MNKPFHLMTPAERTAARIAENRAITDRIAAQGKVEPKPTTAKKATSRAQSAPKVVQTPPSGPSTEFTRLTPDERAQQRGSLIRKV